MGKKLRARCFFDVQIGQDKAGRIVFELYNDICPKTTENFRCLCTGEMGVGKITGKPLHYKGVPFHRVVKNFMIQSGDFSLGNGRGGESIYGGTFDDENFTFKHEKPYLLSMANRGKNTNGSQFFITTVRTPHLDGVHVVFGEVVSGEEIVRAIENTPVDDKSKPSTIITVIDCGELLPELKIKGEEEKKKNKRDASVSVDSDDTDNEKSRKKKKHKKHKKHKKSKKEAHEKKTSVEEEKSDDADEGPQCSVKPDEVPEIPQHNFLMRDLEPKKKKDDDDAAVDAKEVEPRKEREKEMTSKRFRSRSGRLVKGRGNLRYRTPSPRGRSRSKSYTPPHWRTAQERKRPLNGDEKDAGHDDRHRWGRDRRGNSDRDRRDNFGGDRRSQRDRGDDDRHQQRAPDRDVWPSEGSESRRQTSWNDKGSRFRGREDTRGHRRSNERDRGSGVSVVAYPVNVHSSYEKGEKIGDQETKKREERSDKLAIDAKDRESRIDNRSKSPDVRREERKRRQSQSSAGSISNGD